MSKISRANSAYGRLRKHLENSPHHTDIIQDRVSYPDLLALLDGYEHQRSVLECLIGLEELIQVKITQLSKEK